jgi:hypothetical protein
MFADLGHFNIRAVQVMSKNAYMFHHFMVAALGSQLCI